MPVNAQTVLEAAALGKRTLQEQGTLDDDTAYELAVEIVTRTVAVMMRRFVRSNASTAEALSRIPRAAVNVESTQQTPPTR